MLMTIVMTILVASITATIMLRFRDEEKTSMAKIVFGSVAVGLSASVLNNYLVPDHPGLAWLFMLICFVFIGALMYQWHKQGSDLVEFLCFTALTLIVGGIACAAAAHYKLVFPMLLSVWIPIFAIGYYGVTAMKFHAARNTLSDDERAGLLKQEKNETVDEMDSNAAQFHRLMALVAAVTVIALAGTTGLVLGINDNNDTPENQTQPSVAATVNATDTNQDSRFVQEWTENENNRLDSEFAAKLAKKAEADDGTITPEIVQEAVLENCGHDARMLVIWANAFGLRDNPNDYEDLLTEDKSYLSDTGISLYNKVEGYLAATTVTREEAPEDGYNSGYADGYVSADYAGISGDRSGTKFVSPDKNVETFWLMDRCSNLVYRKPNPNVPNGPTDEPTPTPDTPRNMKDQSKIPKKNTEPNDDKGPGENTNNPKDPNHSTKDRSDNSTSGSYKDYTDNQKNLQETNKSQKTGSDSNAPSTPAPKPNTNVDNNGDKGNGGAPINTPTPKREAETVKNDPPADHMDEPS